MPHPSRARMHERNPGNPGNPGNASNHRAAPTPNPGTNAGETAPNPGNRDTNPGNPGTTKRGS
jgi:hypothetical protein